MEGWSKYGLKELTKAPFSFFNTLTLQCGQAFLIKSDKRIINTFGYWYSPTMAARLTSNPRWVCVWWIYQARSGSPRCEVWLSHWSSVWWWIIRLHNAQPIHLSLQARAALTWCWVHLRSVCACVRQGWIFHKSNFLITTFKWWWKNNLFYLPDLKFMTNFFFMNKLECIFCHPHTLRYSFG